MDFSFAMIEGTAGWNNNACKNMEEFLSEHLRTQEQKSNK